MADSQELLSNLAEKLKRADRWHTREKIILLEALQDRFGSEVITVVDEVVAKRAQRFGSLMAQREGVDTLPDLIRLLWESEQGGGLTFSIEKHPDGIQIYCTACPMYDLACEMNSRDWMYHLICAADPYIANGFNPKIGFRRSKTLMQGDECCNHFYFMKE